jgi:WD40 repeat protein
MINVPETTITRTNPYVGPRSFQTNEKLYGRDRELRQLVDRLISERIVLLHSPSGAGKTSLVQAGLIPQMREEDFYIHAIIRVNLERTRDLPCNGNRYIFSTLLSLEEGYPEEARLEKDQLSCMSLDDYLTLRATGDDRSSPELLIFDQFEEVLTTDPSDREGKQAFFSMLGTALKNRDRWALFAMREDYVASLEPYVRAVPTYFTNTFRLDLLGVAAARDAMQKPSRDMGVDFTNEAANKLVDDLRQIQVMGPDGGKESVLGLYVEPVQLQVVCYRLWETLDENDCLVDLDDIAAIGDVDQSLSEYYALSVGNVARQAGVSERSIREWFEDRLITKEGIRGQVLMGASHSEGLDNKAVFLLQNTHIIRAENRAGATWFELAHDRLIEPVRKNNKTWFDANLILLQRQAALWEQQKRSDGLLVRGNDLSEAEKQAETITLTAVEQGFLEACRKQRKVEQRERLRSRIIMGLGIFAGIAFIVAMVFFADAKRSEAAAIMSFEIADQERIAAEAAKAVAKEQQTIAEAAKVEADQQRQEAETQRKEAENLRQEAEGQRQTAFARQLAAQASLVTLDRGRSAIYSGLLSVEAAKRLPGMEAGQSLRRFLDQIGLPVSQFFTDGGVVALYFIEEGELLATASDDGTVRIWDVVTGEEHYRIEFGSSITSLQYNEATDRLAAASIDGSAGIWDAATGDNLVFVVHEAEINAIDFRPDGQQLVTGSMDGTAKLWDALTGELVRTWEAGAEVLSLAYSPDGTRVVVSDRNGQLSILNAGGMYLLFAIQHDTCYEVNHPVFSPDSNFISGACGEYAIVWRAFSGIEVSRKYHKYGVTSVSFSEDSQLVLSAGYDFVARVWESGNGNEISKINHYNTVRNAIFSTDQQRVISSSDDGTVRVWDVETGQEISRMAFDAGVTSSDASPNGQFVASGTQEGVITVWKIDAVREDYIPILNQYYVEYAAIRPDGLEALVVGAGEILFFDTATGEFTRSIILQESPSAFAISPNWEWIAVGSYDYSARVLDGETGSDVALMYHDDAILSIVFSPDGKYVLTGGGDADRTARVWKATTGQEISRITHDARVNSVAFSPDGQLAASASDDFKVYIWDAQTGEIISFIEQEVGLTLVKFSPDGQRILTSGYDSRLSIWEVKTGEQVIMMQMNNMTMDASFSPDGNRVVTANLDGSARVWDAVTGAEISYMIHDNNVEYAIFSPDGNYVASGSQDRTVRVWDAKTGNEIARISHPDWVTALAFSPDSQHVLSGSFVGAIYWSTQVNDLIAEACRRLPRNKFNQTEWITFFPGEPYRDTCPDRQMGIDYEAEQLEPSDLVGFTASSCSLTSDQEATVTFKNLTGRTLDVYWVDFSCAAQYYYTVFEGEEYDQITYLTHTWIFVDSTTGEIVLEYVTDSDASIVEIQ